VNDKSKQITAALSGPIEEGDPLIRKEIKIACLLTLTAERDAPEDFAKEAIETVEQAVSFGFEFVNQGLPPSKRLNLESLTVEESADDED
jgi:hypothetical protein